MKKFSKYIIATMLLFGATTANAQIYAIADRITDLIEPALYGGFNYRGMVEVSAIKGIGNNNADFIGISTTQGFKYADWFFMGVGIGADALFTDVNSYYENHLESVTKHGWIIPLFTDFRFTFGNNNGVNCYVGTKIGCSFLVSDKDIQVNRGYITSDECFYLKPAIGVRIPAGTSNRTAVNISVNYQLITPGFRHYDVGNDESITLNGFGLTVGYEW
jgi:hypothetical protein